MSVSVLAQTLKGSEIIKIGNEINELRRQGEQIANLTIGDFDPQIYPIPDELKQDIIEAYQHNHTNYPPADGMLELRKQVATFLAEEHHINVTPHEILIASGSRPLIYSTFLALVDAGDKVIYPTPSWNNNHYCHITGAVEIQIPTDAENNFLPKAADLKPHLKGATLLCLCSPQNPTGTMFEKADLEEICDLIITENASRQPGEKPLYIMYDQIYAMLTFGKKHYDPVTLRPELKDYTVYIDGISKCLAATGVRVGWGFGPENIIAKMRSIVGHMGAWAPKAEQVATAQYIQQAEPLHNYLNNFSARIQECLNTLYQGFQQLKTEGFAVDAIEPMGAIYLTVKVDYTGKTTPAGDLLQTSADINFYLIKVAKVALVPFSAFGTDDSVNWFRASVGTSTLEDIQGMIPRIREALTQLK
ncbi:aminotransferase class I/II-fold pyridoxal phosphate-dependent enzyme [Mucilaginibacter robiniae]|uniref:Aminotransferase class I/II-fold pyridoxal phosphate-dependent enzyme n=1 Tax=Mucilaginibacter robiniae TaxID=2728022 RepID=A0A7L5DWW7_9SPHI|nr:aminotransferase class I/II-fold pyridoxal phosphate-dependent enzyme [Mucilaginibacter robiniae]QJD95590.1 aminotransferase class I/II-fold pyridoxal phosphate-dependent enzyme [Mucilaginibacter robiniae]